MIPQRILNHVLYQMHAPCQIGKLVNFSRQTMFLAENELANFTKSAVSVCAPVEATTAKQKNLQTDSIRGVGFATTTDQYDYNLCQKSQRALFNIQEK